ncbi:MAG: DUF3842 family protein [Clostridiales bacterium]|nr:DUF3842 family protein [Clostridiales bacterium]
MNIMVVDAQGGGLGRAIIDKLKKSELKINILAVGTNSAATMSMLKSVPDDAATGENAIIYNAQFADYIIGGLGIISANSMHGEISPAIAAAISSSNAVKLLIPTNKCNIFLVGVKENSLGEKIDEAVLKIHQGLTGKP